MKNLTLQTAIQLGFDYENAEFETKEELNELIIDFLNDNLNKLPKVNEHCEINQHGRNQFVNWASLTYDGDYSTSGELFNYSRDYQQAKKGTRFYYANFLVIHKTTGKPFNMNLYIKK